MITLRIVNATLGASVRARGGRTLRLITELVLFLHRPERVSLWVKERDLSFIAGERRGPAEAPLVRPRALREEDLSGDREGL